MYGFGKKIKPFLSSILDFLLIISFLKKHEIWSTIHIKDITYKLCTILEWFVFLFVCNRRDTIAVSRLALNKEAMPIANAGHCCNSGIFHAASPRCFPYTTACQLTQPVVGYTARDTALEFGPPSGTGKLIPLLLDAGTSSCTRLPPPTDGIFPHLAHSHTCVTAQV